MLFTVGSLKKPKLKGNCNAVIASKKYQFLQKMIDLFIINTETKFLPCLVSGLYNY